MAGQNTYESIIEAIFFNRFVPGLREVEFERTDIVSEAARLGVPLPKNLGDVIYSFRYRANLPERIIAAALHGNVWVIRPNGTGRYKFVLERDFKLTPQQMVEIRIPDATPGIVARYALGDEQALLARLRYNRMVDIFTGVVCYSLQNHLRTSIPGMGQVETDEIYVGIDRRGAQLVFPVQAKAGRDRQSIIQIEQDIAICKRKFPELICRPLAAQFLHDRTIVLDEIQVSDAGPGIANERHYRLVPPSEVSSDDLRQYGLWE